MPLRDAPTCLQRLTHVKPLAATAGNVAVMGLRLVFAFAMLACAASVFAQTIYKYRRSDGQTVYSSERLPGLELVDSFEHRPSTTPAPQPGAAESARQAEERIRQYLENLDLAWTEVRNAEQALAEAEARLRAGVEPLAGESQSIAGPALPAPPAVGGPTPPAPPAVGGPGAAAPPAVGGPMGTRRGGGRSPDYTERMGQLEADVAVARARLDRAIRRYNALR